MHAVRACLHACAQAGCLHTLPAAAVAAAAAKLDPPHHRALASEDAPRPQPSARGVSLGRQPGPPTPAVKPDPGRRASSPVRPVRADAPPAAGRGAQRGAMSHRSLGTAKASRDTNLFAGASSLHAEERAKAKAAAPRPVNAAMAAYLQKYTEGGSGGGGSAEYEEPKRKKKKRKGAGTPPLGNAVKIVDQDVSGFAPVSEGHAPSGRHTTAAHDDAEEEEEDGEECECSLTFSHARSPCMRPCVQSAEWRLQPPMQPCSTCSACAATRRHRSCAAVAQPNGARK
eukprot:351505-Chlamydomonas_euryale.AAC.16